MGKDWSKGMQYVPRKICEMCGNKFYVAPCILKRSENSGRFCSFKCKGKHQSIQLGIKYKELRENKNNLLLEKRKIALEKSNKNIKKCPKCGIEFKGKVKYCSSNCYNETRILKVKNNCLNCGKEYLQLKWEHDNKVHLYCSISCSMIYRNKLNPEKMYSNSKGGKRIDLNNKYFRSRWEANYARYLNFLVSHKDILKWEYEADTFIFHNITKGTRSYLPDFKIFNNDGSIEYHEVKGYNSPISQTKLKRMAKYYPEIKMELIDTKRYMTLHRQLKSIIPNWETDDSHKKAYLYR